MSRVIHFEIHCADLDRAERFYTDVFGWTIQRMTGPMDYRLINTGPDSEPGINGALVGRRGEIDGEAVIAYVCTINVEDLDAIQNKVLADGGVIALERMEVPEVGDLAYYKDTEGNIFGVLQPV
ncbi:MAG TPA: VOC family protein [Solirubrobacteraceae bacterium]